MQMHLIIASLNLLLIKLLVAVLRIPKYYLINVTLTAILITSRYKHCKPQSPQLHLLAMNSFIFLIGCILLITLTEMKTLCKSNTFKNSSVQVCRENVCETQWATSCLHNNITFSDVTSVKFTSPVHKIRRGAIMNLSRLRYIEMDFCEVEDLLQGCFINLPSVDMFNGTGNHISEVRYGVFTGMNFSAIFLSDNQIESIEEHTFSNMSSLQILNLANNKLKTLYSDWLVNADSLYFLSLYNNTIEDIKEDAFGNSNKLSLLFLGKNKINSIEQNVFNSNKYYVLDLSQNKLTELNPKSFKKGTYVSSFQLEFNYLRHLSYEMLHSIKVRSFLLHPNPWICSCLDNMLESLQRRKVNVMDPMNDPLVVWKTNYPVCAIPNNTQECTLFKTENDEAFINYFHVVLYDDIVCKNNLIDKNAKFKNLHSIKSMYTLIKAIEE